MDPKKKWQRNAIHTNCKKQLDIASGFPAKISAESVPEIEICVAKLKEYRLKLSTLDSEIIAEIENEEEGTEQAQAAADWDDQLIEASTLLARKLKTFIDNSLVVATPDPFGSQQSLSSSRAMSVKLPKLEITKFGGDPMKWQEFWDSFSSTIHSNNDLSEIDKFKYLIAFLTGDIKPVVQSYRLTAENYETVVEMLKERFGNPQLAIFSHFEALLAMPVASHDTQQLQTAFDKCELHIRSLIALGLPEETFGQVFTPIILSKMPIYVKMEIHRRNGSKPWTLQNLRDMLKEEIRVRSFSQYTINTKPATESAKPKNDRRNNNNHEKLQKGAGSSASLLADGSNKQSNQTTKTPRCSFCGDSHYSDACPTYTDLPSRQEKVKGRCFKCLSSRHAPKECRVNYNCAHCGSNEHHRALCPEKFGGQDTSTAACVDSSESQMVSTANTVNSTLLCHNEKVILQTSLTKIKAKYTQRARMLFDTGCSRTFITSKMAQKIGARQVGDEVVSIAAFSDTKRKTVKYPIVEFDILLLDGSKQTFTANVTPTISCPVQKYAIDVKKHPIVKQLTLSEPLCVKNEPVNIDVLVGNDYYYDIIGTERIKCPDGLIFLSSSVGFIATGRVGWKKDSSENKTTVSSLLLEKSDVDVNYETSFQVEKFWSLEDIGVKTPSSTNDDEDVLSKFNATIKFKDGRYAVKWPWKSEAPDLPENYHLALGRLKSLLKKLKHDETLLKTYDQTIKDQKEKGVVEEVQNIETEHKIHYIPHHCVVTPGKATTKVRIVYDASAKQSKNSPSINDCLHRGPVLLDDLCGLLMRFRLHKIALVSDIEKAFLQVSLQEDSKDVTRFLWVKDLSKPPEGDNLIVYRFLRVPFGFKPSPFLLGGTVQYHVTQSDSSIGKEIKNDIYVDNVFAGKETNEESKDFYTKAKKLFADASMNLREWFTNSPEVNDFIKEIDRGKTTETKVLGMLWDTKQDLISCSSFSVNEDTINTKRLMLKYLAKVFDPCGYFSAVTVSGKILIQKLWKEKCDWDDILPQEILEEWSNIAPGLKNISNHKMERCLVENNDGSATRFSLHCFCDASGKAYSAVVFLVETTKKKINVNIIFAKSRVAPLKTLSIPRLELMALLIGTRLISFVATQLRITIHEKYVWSDSQCVLHWLVKPDISTVFVKNRITEIKTYEGIQFRYVPTAQNPADISSRGCSYEFLSTSELWWKGPKFLSKQKDHWPKNVTTKESEEMLEEGQPKDEVKYEAKLALLTTDESFRLKPNNYSSLTRLLRVTSWVLRFIRNARNPASRCTGELSADEMADSRKYWELRVQQENFPMSNYEELRRTFKPLDVSIDCQGLLRCSTRLAFADVEATAKQPIMLPKHCDFTNLVILEAHQIVFHDGIAHTLAQLRTRYWVVHGRTQVKQVLRGCRVCKLRYGGPFKVPNFPPLPEFRVTRQKPFDTVGIDYLGPLRIKNDNSDESKKVWICIFTCTAIRAIHLEVVEQLSAQQFLLCLRRFISKFTIPAMIISDNAKHFKATEETLSKIWKTIQNNSDVQAFAASKGIRWKFITEFAPWMGGFYERLVGIVKRALKTSLDLRCVSLIELQTIVAEVSAVVNSRPLLYSETDLSDAALTPAHFLGGTCCDLPTVSDNDENFQIKQVKADDLVKYYNRLQKILDSFWSMWRSQYLFSLRANFNNVHKQRNVSDYRPSVGTVVLLKDNLPRCQWRMGVITSVKLSDDGQIRSAQVKVSNGKILNRPIKLLYPLEVSASSTSDTETFEAEGRLKRRAAIAAAQRIKSQAKILDASIEL